MVIETKDQLIEETAKRVAKMTAEFLVFPELKVFENIKKYNQIIAQVGVPCTGLCEHHRLEFRGDVSIGYIPDRFVVGLSKLARVAEFYMNPTRATLQEEITMNIADVLEEGLDPKGIMVVVRAHHGCIENRGVKKKTLTITSEVRGIFRSDLGARSEFLELMKLNNI